MADALARDALSAVFTHLPLKSLYVARKVCKEWRAVASEDVQRLGLLPDMDRFEQWCATACGILLAAYDPHERETSSAEMIKDGSFRDLVRCDQLMPRMVCVSAQVVLSCWNLIPQ